MHWYSWLCPRDIACYEEGTKLVKAKFKLVILELVCLIAFCFATDIHMWYTKWLSISQNRIHKMYEQIEFTKYICISICLELAKYASMKTMLYCLCIKIFFVFALCSRQFRYKRKMTNISSKTLQSHGSEWYAGVGKYGGSLWSQTMAIEMIVGTRKGSPQRAIPR